MAISDFIRLRKLGYYLLFSYLFAKFRWNLEFSQIVSYC